MELRTPYFAQHREMGATFLPEGGWRLVTKYQDKSEEVKAVINDVGMIDFSSMGTFIVAGTDALDVLQYVCVNDIGSLTPGRGVYSQICDESGAVTDDVTVFLMRPGQYLVVTSTAFAAGTQKLLKQFRENRDVYVIDGNFGVLCFGGPKARDFAASLAPETKNLNFFDSVITEIPAENASIPCLVARAGITGELGYEIYSSAKYCDALWKVLFEKGKDFNLKAIGLQAMFSLCLEKGYLAGKDFYPGASPIHLGVGWTVKFDKGDFLGRAALLKQKESGVETQLAGFEVLETDDVVKQDSEIFKDGEPVGKVTNANYGYRVKKSLVRGWIRTDKWEEGGMYEVREGDRKYRLKLVRTPFYDPENKIVKG